MYRRILHIVSLLLIVSLDLKVLVPGQTGEGVLGVGTMYTDRGTVQYRYCTV